MKRNKFCLVHEEKHTQKKIMSERNKRVYDGNGHIVLENKKIRSKVQRDNIIKKFLNDGAEDKRNPEKKCIGCLKFHVPCENINYILKDNETFTGSKIIKKTNKVYWQSLCVSCIAKKTENDYKNGGTRFFRSLANGLRFHMNGTSDDRKKALDAIINRDGLTCTSCGVEVIAKGKSGWRQLSVNNKHPNVFVDSVPVSNLVVSCQACNMFQNSLEWSIFLEALLRIASGPKKYYINNSAVTDEEEKYLKQKGLSDDKCPLQLKIEIIEEYGRNCFFTGEPLKFISHDPFTISFDRFDSSKPYTLEGTRPVAKHINLAKKINITEDHIREWIEHLRKNKEYIVENIRQL